MRAQVGLQQYLGRIERVYYYGDLGFTLDTCSRQTAVMCCRQRLEHRRHDNTCARLTDGSVQGNFGDSWKNGERLHLPARIGQEVPSVEVLAYYSPLLFDMNPSEVHLFRTNKTR